MGNPFVHVELHVPDVPAAKKFYADLFEWDLADINTGGMPYTSVSVGEGTGGGMMNDGNGAPPHWLPYILVADVAAATDKAKSLGATVVFERTEVPGMGTFSIISDPLGASVGLWQPAK